MYTSSQVYTAGIKNIDLYFIITEVAGPVILMLSLSVVIPYVLAEAIITIAGNCHLIVHKLCDVLCRSVTSSSTHHRTNYLSIDCTDHYLRGLDLFSDQTVSEDVSKSQK